MLKISALIMFAILGSISIAAQDSEVIKMKMAAMEKSPQHLMTMAYRQNVKTFAKSLRDMSKGGKLDNLEMARKCLSEMKRNMAKTEESHLLHMETMTSEMNQIMFPMMEKMHAENTLVKEHIAALEKALEGATPNAATVYKHAAEIAKQLEKMDTPDKKKSGMSDKKMKM